MYSFSGQLKTLSLSPRATTPPTTTMSILLPTNLQQCPSSSLSPLLSPSPSSVIGTRRRCLRFITSSVSSVQRSVANGSPAPAVVVERDQIRLGLPSKGRMAADAIDLLKVRDFTLMDISREKTNFHGKIDYPCKAITLKVKLLLILFSAFVNFKSYSLIRG